MPTCWCSIRFIKSVAASTGDHLAFVDSDDKLPEEGKAEVNSAIADLKKALEGTDIGEVKAKHEALSTASQKLGLCAGLA